MNNIILKGIIKNIVQEGSNNYKSSLIVQRPDGKEDIVDLRFKNRAQIPTENSIVELVGSLRTHSQKLENKNKVELYVSTMFEKPTSKIEEDFVNYVELEGYICKKSVPRKTTSGKNIIDFILANNIETRKKLINSYIPSVTWGRNVTIIDKLPIGSKIKVTGRYQSRTYKKYINENDFEYRTACEFAINTIETDTEKFEQFGELE